jgi:hypothetical protein
MLLEGRSNPIFEQQLDPAIHADMHNYLTGLQKRHANVILISASSLPQQTAEDYVDIDHVNEDMQRRFTLHLAGLLQQWLEDLKTESHIQPKS